MNNQHLDKRDPIIPLSPKRQERILEMTMKKINENRPEAPIRSRRPLRLIAATAGIAALLCATAFAAVELKLFDFSNLFGERAALIEEAVTTYTPAPEGAISAFDGRTEQNFTATEDYNFLLLDTVQASDTLLRATFDVSTVSETIPEFTETALRLEIDGYETSFFSRPMEPGTQRVTVYASLDAPLPEGAEVSFLVTNGENAQPVLEHIPVTPLDANMAVFTDPSPDADYVLDTAVLTGQSLTVTGHFQTEHDNYVEALDASGSMVIHNIPWPLYDQSMDTYDPEDGAYHEDQEGYLVLRDVADDGSFTLEWSFVKGMMPEWGMTIQFGGGSYVLPELEIEEAEPEEYTPTFATSAETQDYRFTLESIAASSNAIYAVVDMEPITDYGKAHMNLSGQDLDILCSDMTNYGNGTSGSALLEAGDAMSRYLVYSICEGMDVYQPKDIINFQIFSIREDGDTRSHGYSLFDVELEAVSPARAEAHKISEGFGGLVSYDTVTVTPFSLYLEGQYSGSTDGNWLSAADEAGATPEIILNFKDGTSATICDDAWRVPSDLTSFGKYGVAMTTTSGHETENGGVIYQAFLFSQVVSLEELDTISINGTLYQVDYEIG